MTRQPPSAPIRVLVVDDDQSFAEMTAAFLKRHHEGWTVETASSAEAALERLDGVDCVVSDYEMPGADGLEFLEAVHADDPDLPFILFTGRGSEEIASQAISAGVTDYLQKTGRTEQYERLANRIQQTTRARATERAAEESQAYLEAIVENSEAVILTIDESSTVQFVSDAVEAVFGYEPAEIEGASLTRLMPERFRDRHQAGLDRYLEAGERELDWAWVEFPGQHHDGHELPLAISFSEFTLDGEQLFTGIIRDLSEQADREQAIQEERRRFELLTQEIEDYAIFMLDPDGHVISWNAGAERIKGYTEDEILGEHLSEFYTDEARAAGRPGALLARATEAGRVEDEGWRVRKDGTRFWGLVVITALFDDGELQGYAKVTRDMTDRKRHEDRLAGLNDLLTELLLAEESGAVWDAAVDVAAERLQLPLTAVASFDDGELRPAGVTPLATAHLDVAGLLEDGPGWAAFTDGTLTVVSDPGDEFLDGAVDAKHLVVQPLGRHGVFITALEEAVTGDVEDVVETVAGGMRGALDRLAREETLREREARLESQTERLDQLNRLNDVIRGIDRALVEASTREAIERTVCEELVAEGPYPFAWLGHYDAVSGTVMPTEPSDVDLGNFDEAADGGNPTVRAAESNSAVVVDDVLDDPPLVPWRKTALDRGYRACIAVPVSYRDRRYGVLTVYADRPNAFDELEREVLAEFGGTIGHAINSIESRQALVREALVELEFELPIEAVPFLEAVEAVGDAEFELEGLIPDDHGLRVFFTLRHATDGIVKQLAAASVVRSCSQLAERDEATFYECRLTDESLLAWLVDHTAVPSSLTFDGAVHLTVSLPEGTDVREFVGLLQSACEGAELVARRDRERPAQTRATFGTELEAQLTPRQLEVLETAYFSGFFDSPREQTGQQIAASLDISQPTFSNHLRAGLGKLLGMLFAIDRDRDERPTESDGG